MREYWFVQIVNKVAISRLWFGVLLLAVLGGFFLWMFGAFDPGLERTEGHYVTNIGTALFFSFINAYALVTVTYIIERAQGSLDKMRDMLSCSDVEFIEIRTSMGAAPMGFILTITLGSLVVGIAHNMVLWGTVANFIPAVTSSKMALGTTLGALLTWVVLTTVVSTFVRNAQTLSRLGRDFAKIDLLKPHALRPFGTIALLPALGLLGTQMLYPLLSIDGDFNASAVVPGFLLTLASLGYLFATSIRSIHGRLVDEKSLAIAAIDAEISRWQSRHSVQTEDSIYTAESLITLQPMLTHRQYLETVPEWPFSVSTLARWGLYLIIPPVTWVCAALMENLIDRIVG